MNIAKFLCRIISVLLVFSVVASLTACGNNKNKYVQKEPDFSGIGDWLHPNELPLVSGKEKKLSFAVRKANDGLDASERYMYKFIENTMNIKFDKFDYIGGEEQGTYVTLSFADGESMPDVFIGFKFTPAQLIQYGKEERQIVDLAPYITKELTPNLYSLFEKHPEYKKAITDQEGHIWSLSYISNPTDKTEINRMFYNYEWLEKLNLQVPTTVDEFIDVLRAFKKIDTGVVPMGGSYALFDPTGIILAAYGYLTDDPTGCTIAKRNGKVVLPIADKGAFGEYIKTMKTLYSEGLIDKKFYTMQGNATRAVISEGKTGFIAQAPSLFLPQEETRKWWAASPLTSKYCKTPIWPSKTSSLGVGNFVVSSSCKNIELAMAFADYFYDENSLGYTRAARGSGAHETDYLYENDWFKGAYFDESKQDVSAYVTDKITASDVGSYNWRCQNVMLWNTGVIGYSNPLSTALQILTNQLDNESLLLSGPSHLDDPNYNQLRYTLPYQDLYKVAMEVPAQYVQECLPTAFLDSDLSNEANTLLVSLKDYATQEIAKFVTGKRPISEINDYFDEMEALGASRYVEIYKDYYSHE